MDSISRQSDQDPSAVDLYRFKSPRRDHLHHRPAAIRPPRLPLAGASGPALTDSLAQQAAADPAQNVTYKGTFHLTNSEEVSESYPRREGCRMAAVAFCMASNTIGTQPGQDFADRAGHDRELIRLGGRPGRRPGQGGAPALERQGRTAPVQWPKQSPGEGLEGVTAIPGGSAWALNYFGEPKPGDKTAILHWSGQAWTVAWQLTQPAGYLTGIGVVSSTDAWSIGYICTATGNDNGRAKNQYLVLHWNGRTWNESWLPANSQPAR